jgi:transcriptional regulator with XRE-family HTH domain
MQTRVDLGKIRRLREAKNLSQREMGLKLGLLTGTGYQYLESGKRGMKADYLAAIAQIFQVPMEDLMVRDGRK